MGYSVVDFTLVFNFLQYLVWQIILGFGHKCKVSGGIF